MYDSATYPSIDVQVGNETTTRQTQNPVPHTSHNTQTTKALGIQTEAEVVHNVEGVAAEVIHNDPSKI